MKMRLKPPLKRDGKGNKVPDFVAQNGKGYYLKRKWYASFKYEKNFYGDSLQAEEKDEFKALNNLNILYNEVINGKYRKGLKTKIKDLTPVDLKKFKPKTFSVEDAGIQKNWIIPFFGNLTPNELTKELLVKYMEQKWGRNEEGKLQAMERTLKAHLGVLKSLCKSADQAFDFDELTHGLKYDSQNRDLLPPLEKNQIDKAWEAAKKTRNRKEGEIFKKSFWIMVYTGIEAMDIWDLRPSHFVPVGGQVWLIKDRHKTKYNNRKTVIKIPVLPQLKKIIDSLPTPINKNTRYLENLDQKTFTENCNQAIGRYFLKAGLDGYGSKYLRRYMGKQLTELGYSEAFIGQVLAHAQDSKQTKKYMKVSDGAMLEAWNKIAKSG
jgi:integrase